MGSWTIWHFVAVIAVALVAAWSANKSKAGPAATGYGGWLIALSLFLLFWAAQELAEFYRVKTLIGVLMPSALQNPDYLEYIAYAKSLAWLEAILLAACAGLLAISRARWTVKAIVAVLWLAGPICAAIEFALAESYFGEYLLEKDYSALAATTLFATIGTWYLATSKRVKNTYRGRQAR